MISHQQFEFLIRFTNFCRRDLLKCIARLPRRPDGRARQPHYELRLEPEGFYFHDRARSDFSARMLRVVLELALEHSEVQIEGFSSGIASTSSSRNPAVFADVEAVLSRYRETLWRLGPVEGAATTGLAED